MGESYQTFKEKLLQNFLKLFQKYWTFSNAFYEAIMMLILKLDKDMKRKEL